ncbi:MAG: biopolymer transporter ExbD [Terrimicrobiaceae bacterium]
MEVPRGTDAMRRYTTRTSLSTLAELNITPLLDLAFVLLIIFMITTPMIESRVDLVVPSSATAQIPVNPSEVKTIEVIRSGELRMEEQSYSAPELEARLAEMKASDPQLAVVVRPDKELPVQQFIDVMDILKRVGIGKVGVMTRPMEKPATP